MKFENETLLVYENFLIVGSIVTNKSLSVDEFLNMIDFDEQEFIDKHDFDDIDYNDFSIKTINNNDFHVQYKENTGWRNWMTYNNFTFANMTRNRLEKSSKESRIIVV